MHKKLPASSGNVIGFKISGTADDKDYRVIIPEAVNVIKKEGSVNILFDLTDLEDYTFQAGFDDISFALEYKDDIKKFAIVGGDKWEEELAKLNKWFIGTEVKYFSSEDINKAWAWLKNK